MRFVLLMVCGLLVGCGVPEPIYVEVPGLTPLSNVQRATWTEGNRRDLWNSCMAAEGPLAAAPKEKLCRCLVGTAPVYATMAMLEDENRVVRGKTPEQVVRSDGLTAKFIYACGNVAVR